MPIDYRIPALARTPKINTPFENLDVVLQEERARSEISARRTQEEQRRRLMAEQDAFQQTVSQLPDFSDESLDALVRVSPNFGMKLRDGLADQRKKVQEAAKIEHENEKAEHAAGMSFLAVAEMGGPDAYRALYPHMAKKMPELASFLGPEYDPQKIQAAKQYAVDQQKRQEQQASALSALYKGEAGGIAQAFIDEQDPEARKGLLDTATLWLGPQGAAQLAKNPQAFAMTPAQRADDKRADTAAQALAAERRTDNARADEQLNISRQHLGLAQQANQRAAAQGSGPKTLSPTAESNVINRLSQQWTSANKTGAELDRAINLMDAGLNAARRGDLAQGSQAVLITFQKILDPTSVVRESEYERSAAGQALLTRARGAFERLTQGGAGVPLAELEKFANLAREAAAAQKKSLPGVRDRLRKTAERYNIPPELVLGAEPAAAAGADTPAAPASAPATGAAPKVGDVKTFPNGKRGRWDGKGWELIQ